MSTSELLNHYRRLLQNYLAGYPGENKTAALEHTEELFDFISQDSPLSRQLLDGLSTEEYQLLIQPSQSLDPALSARMQERLAAALSESEVYHLPRRNKPFWRAAAAAAILITISTITWFFIHQNRNTSPTHSNNNISFNPAVDVAPGNNRATLTLSNGARISLDSARNGLLASQSGVHIIKTDAGSLAYQSNQNNNNNHNNHSEISYNTLSTPRGGQYQLTLPDGTRVWLNAASSITYPTAFTGNERNVSVTGEVYLEVVHNDQHPFTASAGDVKIRDIGTHFNINAYPDNPVLETTVLEGSVNVSAIGQSVVCKAGEQARAGESFLGHTDHVNLEQIIAWKNGKMSLTNNSVEEIMRQISRWYDVDIQYVAKIPENNFSGSLNRNVPLSTVLNGLKLYGIQTELKGKTLIVK